MWKKDLDLWKKYHLGLINRELTNSEIKEIKASDFAMHLLVPTNAISQFCDENGGVEQVILSDDMIKALANHFKVDEYVIYFKLQYLYKQKSRENHIKLKIKKDGNILHITF